MSLDEFAYYLNTIPSDECLVLGNNKFADYGQLVSGRTNEHYASNFFCRTKDNFF